jgi:hypothetical protein
MRPARTGRRRPWLPLIVWLATLAPLAAEITCEWRGVERIVAVADLHGDFNRFTQILRGTGLIDESFDWSGGSVHLVQLGDVMDRGARARDIFDLLIKLEKQAREAGGEVHVLLGNHEEANLLGTVLDVKGYLNWRQFVSFLPENFREKMENKLRKELVENPPEGDGVEARTARFWTDLMTGDAKARSLYIRNFRKLYMKWLLKKNVVIRINDVIFVHGGISEEYSTWSLKDINKRARLEMDAYIRERAVPRKIVYVDDGPLWFRGLIRFDEKDFQDDVKRILDNLDARVIVVGHTVRKDVPSGNLSRFGGRVWGIDTGISGFYGGPLSALIIEGDRFTVWRSGGSDE